MLDARSPIPRAIASVLALPAATFAQAVITGNVKDTSGAVLPGVTVEAASPVLIEKVRSGVSGGNGIYRIEDLRPGTYSVTFTLPGFKTFKREGIILTGTFTASVDADMAVGGLEETVTVTGESPIVDVQSAGHEQTLNNDVLKAIPTVRSYNAMVVVVPGVVTNLNDTVTGTATTQSGVLRSHLGERERPRPLAGEREEQDQRLLGRAGDVPQA